MSASIGASTWLRMAIIVVIAASFGLAACAGEPPEVTVDDPELVTGRDVYARNCASCHGASGGGGVGNKLSNGASVEAYPNIKDQIDLIANGKGTMPAYVGRLSGEQMQAVARYTREVL
ncbi:MAG: c-type cytochrome [Acidimicrobiales bacterium]